MSLNTGYPSEHLEQVRFVAWFEKNYPQYKIFAIPNGGLRNKVVAANLKAEGVRPGVPDLFIPGLFLFIEMKRQKGGRMSDKQKEWKEHLENLGYSFFVGHGFEDAKEKFTSIVDKLCQLNLN